MSDDEWNFVAPYLILINQDAPQREYPLREVFNALRYIARGGEAWRMAADSTTYDRYNLDAGQFVASLWR